MEVYRIPASSNLPGYEVWGGSEYYLRARWATDPALLTEPPSAVILPSNYCESPLVWVAWEPTPIDPIALQPDLSWWTYLKPTLRNLYCRIDWRTESSSSWIFFRDAIFIVNHDPIANAGPPLQINLDVSAQTPVDIYLDGSGSLDHDFFDPINPDPGPLHYNWDLINNPSSIDTSGFIYNAATSLDPVPNPLFLPQGTPIPSTDEGIYSFRLTVTDNDITNIGIHIGKSGKDTSDVTIVLKSIPPNLTINSPTSTTPWIFNAQTGGRVPITYSIGSSTATGTTLGGAWMLRLTIIQASNWPVTSSPTPVSTVVFEQTRIDPQLNGNFYWNGIITNPDPAINGRQAVGKFDIKLELLDRYGSSTVDPTTVTSNSQSVFIYASLSQEMCADILQIPNIQLANFHSSGNVDNATALDNIQDVANGGLASRSTYSVGSKPAAPGGTTNLDPNMLLCLAEASLHWDIFVTEIAGGCHSLGSLHYAGTAFDVGMIDDAAANAANGASLPFMNFCVMEGAIEVLGPVPAPGDAGHTDHIHAHW